MKYSSLFRKSLLLCGWLSACGGADPTPGAPGSAYVSPGVSHGMMEVRLVDAPSDEVKEIVVTIVKVTAHVAGGGGWMIIGEREGTIDLLKLQAGTFAQLGVVKMPAGRVTQLRLYVKADGPNYVTTPDGKQHPLTVPSGVQSGIKLKGGFDWPACGTGNVTIDFDGKKSIHVHPKGAGAGDEWLLRPVVRLKSVSVTTDGCVDAGTPAPMPPDGGVTPEPDPLPTPMPMDAGAPSDAGTPPVVMPPPVMTTPPGDPCANVTCADSLVCFNGSCVPQVD